MLSRALLAGLLLLTPGCLWVYTPDLSAPRWPVRQLGDARGAARPTALVRRRALDERGERLEGPLSLAEELRGVPEESGLFSRVDHQPGLDGFTVEADYTLDFMIEREFDFGCYSYLGIVPGIPLVLGEPLELICVVRDRDQSELDIVRVTRERTLAVSLIALPFNLLFTLLPGDFGFDLVGTAEDQHALLVDMIQEALYRADERCRFAAPEAGPVEGGHRRD